MVTRQPSGTKPGAASQVWLIYLATDDLARQLRINSVLEYPGWLGLNHRFCRPFNEVPGRTEILASCSPPERGTHILNLGSPRSPGEEKAVAGTIQGAVHRVLEGQTDNARR